MKKEGAFQYDNDAPPERFLTHYIVSGSLYITSDDYRGDILQRQIVMNSRDS